MRADDDDAQAIDMLDQETGQVRARKFKRIHTVVTSEVLLRPLKHARYAMWIIAAVITIVEAIAFNRIFAYMTKHASAVSFLKACGSNLKVKRLI